MGADAAVAVGAVPEAEGDAVNPNSHFPPKLPLKSVGLYGRKSPKFLKLCVYTLKERSILPNSRALLRMMEETFSSTFSQHKIVPVFPSVPLDLCVIELWNYV